MAMAWPTDPSSCQLAEPLSTPTYRTCHTHTQIRSILDTVQDPERAKVAVNSERLKTLMQAYLTLPGGAEYQTAMAGFQAAAQNYNAMQLKINYLWAGIMQSQKDRVSLQAQIDTVKVCGSHAAVSMAPGAIV